MGFDGLLPALQSEKIDVVLGVSSTPDRQKIIDFTTPYIPGEVQILLVHKDSDITTDNLVDKSIGVQLGTTLEIRANGIEGAIVKSYNNYTGALLDLNSKKIDSVLVSKNPSKEYLKQNPDLKVGGELENLDNAGYAIGMNKSDKILREKLNKSIQKLLDDGTVGKYIKKYNVE